MLLGALASLAVARYAFFGRETVSFLRVLAIALPGVVTGMALSTFRHVTFPALRSAFVAGGLLAFALSFDEVIVTLFMAGGVKTLPIWIFQSFRLANQVPLVNVAGLVAILLSVIPVYLATRLSGGVVGARG